MKIYAAYGSNMNIEQMKDRCPKAKIYGNGILYNHTLKFRGRGHANIQKEEDSLVPIVLWEISEECEKELDKYEEYPEYYIKETVNIETDDGVVEALIYKMTDKMSGIDALPTDEYYETIYKGYEDNDIDVEIFKRFGK